MAPVIVPIISIGASSLVGGGIIGSVVGAIAGQVVGGLLNKNSRRGGGARAQQQQRRDQGQLQTIISNEADFQRVYGQTRVGMIVTDQFVTNASGVVDDEGEFAYNVYLLSVGEIEAITSLWYYDLLVTDTISYGATISGNSIEEKFRDQVRVEFFRGGTQTVSPMLSGIMGRLVIAGDGTTSVNTSQRRYSNNDVGTGLAYMVVRIQRTEGGIIGEATPQNFTVDIQGRRMPLVNVAGSPTRYSNNPALIALQEARNPGFGRVAVENRFIDIDSFAAVANECAARNFEFNGRMPQGATLGEIFDILGNHGDFNVIDIGGRLTCRANMLVSGSNTVKITENNVVSRMVRRSPQSSTISSEIYVNYKTPEAIETNAIVKFNSATRTRFGQAKPQTLDLYGCTSKAQAIELGNRALLQQLSHFVTGEMDNLGYGLNVGDVAEIDFDLSKQFPAGTRIQMTALDKRRLADNKPVKFSGFVYESGLYS